MAAVGQAITNLMLTSSILSEYIEFLHRFNYFAFKPCEYCMPPDAEGPGNNVMSYKEIAEKYLSQSASVD